MEKIFLAIAKFGETEFLVGTYHDKRGRWQVMKQASKDIRALIWDEWQHKVVLHYELRVTTPDRLTVELPILAQAETYIKTLLPGESNGPAH